MKKILLLALLGSCASTFATNMAIPIYVHNMTHDTTFQSTTNTKLQIDHTRNRSVDTEVMVFKDLNGQNEKWVSLTDPNTYFHAYYSNTDELTIHLNNGQNSTLQMRMEGNGGKDGHCVYSTKQQNTFVCTFNNKNPKGLNIFFIG